MNALQGRTIENDRRVEILGCPVDALSLEETVAHSRELIAQRVGATQVSINSFKIALAHEDPQFMALLHSFQVASADGQPVVWASRLLKRSLPGRVNGTDLMEQLLSVAERDGLRVYLLGARASTLKRAIRRILTLHPQLHIAGFRDGYFSEDQEQEVVQRIADAEADILFVAMPSPRKERFLSRHAVSCDVGFAMGVGGSLDVLAGDVPRAPRWMQRWGLEWLHRTLVDPRLWQRYIRANTRFVILLVNEWVTLSKKRILPGGQNRI